MEPLLSPPFFRRKEEEEERKREKEEISSPLPLGSKVVHKG
jgi:hypothetical protein